MAAVVPPFRFKLKVPKLALQLASFAALCSPVTAEQVDFVRDVLPIFSQHCFSCHGPTKQTSSYRLDHRETAFRGGDSGESAIIPKRSIDSHLINLVRATDAPPSMPPSDSDIAPLSESQINTLLRWIDSGAPWPNEASVTIEAPTDWWSLKPLPLPSVPLASEQTIDAFIVKKLHSEKLGLAPETDARTLCRRLSFDLHGLPPTAEMLTAFEHDYRIDPERSYQRLVDSLLASPRYGERWARHWLDAVHYGDTHGYDKDQPRPNAWPYRDYVIRAFNADKPYARFVEEQIAGDVLYPDTQDGVEALGFIAAGPWDFIGHAEVPESKIDGKIARHLDRDDMVGNAIGTLCSATIQCAQCHNHKFDPFTQQDYYSLHAVFAALDRADKPYDIKPETAEKRRALANEKLRLQTELEQIEASIAAACGPEYMTLMKAMKEAESATKRVQPPEYGWHSAIAKNENESKWVQIDLGKLVEIHEIVLIPASDSFNQIGDGFGYPKRMRIEISADAEAPLTWISVYQEPTQSLTNPGISPQSFAVKGQTSRWVRVTATQLATRANDYIFALAEIQVLDRSSKNVSHQARVDSLDTIEASPRWGRKNLVDGIYPQAPKSSMKALAEEREKLIENHVSETERQRYASTQTAFHEIEAALAKLPPMRKVFAGTVHYGSGSFVGTGNAGGKPREIRLLSRGQVTKPGNVIGPGALAVIAPLRNCFDLPSSSTEGQRRAALAQWIADPRNPLTWRSIVNRVWQHHFGRGIVESANDFGRMGTKPSHPELLDWLAAKFRDQGGSLKELHRWIVTSRTYKQTSIVTSPTAILQDPNYSLLWRQHRRKLDAESLRDAVLFVSGSLDLRMGGAGWQDFVVTNPAHSPHYEYELYDPRDPSTWRRSIYRFIVRSQTQPFMTVMDCADPSMRVERRNESVSPNQALALLNNGFMVVQSERFAQRILQMNLQNEQEQLRVAFQLALGREPDEVTLDSLVLYCQKHGLANVCRALFNLNEFMFVD